MMLATQAQLVLTDHDGRVAAPDTMIYWLAAAAKQMRQQHDPPRKQVHIAASMSSDQSTIYRFEQGERWPRQTDLVIAAYADDLGLEDPREIWQLALELWAEHGQTADVETLRERASGERFARESERAV